MQQFVIGTPGQPPRMIFASSIDGQAQAQVRVGEVCFVLPDDASPPYSISTDGTTLINSPISLDALRDGLWNDAKAYRNSRMSSVCSTPSGTVQIDDASRVKLNSAITNAISAKLAGTSFSKEWTLLSNEVVTLDADAMIAVGTAVATFDDNCQTAGTAIRTKIEQAPDAATLNGIDITANYPS